MQAQWERLQKAERLARQETERCCKLFDCYEWEIEYERERPQNQRKEILPYIYKHAENGIELTQEEMYELCVKHKLLNGEEEGEVAFDVETTPVEFLEDLLQLYIKHADMKKAKAHVM